MTTESNTEREAFEEKAFAQRYIKSIKRVSDSNITGLAPVGCPTKVEFVKRNEDGSYVDPTLDAMWWAWQAALRADQAREAIDHGAVWRAINDLKLACWSFDTQDLLKAEEAIRAALSTSQAKKG